MSPALGDCGYQQEYAGDHKQGWKDHVASADMVESIPDPYLSQAL